MRKTFKHILLLMLFLIYQSVAMAETVVIVNNSNSTSSLNLHNLNRIFTGKKKHWENGEQIVIFLPEVGSNSLIALSSKVFKKNNPSAIAKFYLKAVFQQKFASPPTVSIEPEIDIAENQGGIAVIDRKHLPRNNQVKIIKVEGL